MTPQQQLEQLAAGYRAAQFYAHMAHNLTSGPTFYQDHKAFASLYEAYEAAYDSLIERSIGLGGTPDIPEITKSACDMLCKYAEHKSPNEFFATLKNSEIEFQGFIVDTLKRQTCGTQNLLQGLADESEQRVYKIQQRLSK